MNPPFGTRKKGADLEFLSVAMKVWKKIVWMLVININLRVMKTLIYLCFIFRFIRLLLKLYILCIRLQQEM
jgi:hypothetical protein